jgi:hypothetical protein
MVPLTITRRSSSRQKRSRELPRGLRRESGSGSLLLEAIVAIGVFGIFLGGIGLSLLLGQRSTIAAGDRVRATFIAEKQLEALRQMGTESFARLAVGTRGMVQTGTGWRFSGSSVTQNGFVGSVTITQHATDWMDISSRVGWNFKNTRSGSVVLQSSITNWQKPFAIGNWASMGKIAEVTISGTPDLQKVAVTGNYAFVTSTVLVNGKGLYIFDVTNPASPTQTNTSFNLGASAYGLVADGSRLYLATDNPTNEVQVYDTTAPTTLTTAQMINSYDLPSSQQGRSLALYGTTLFVGTEDHPPDKQLSALQLSETGPITLLSSLSVSGSALGLALRDGYAYLSTSYNVGELQVVDIFDPEAMKFAPGAGIDLTDTHDGQAIAVSGTSALLGRSEGSGIDELILYSVADSPVPAPPPGPWTLEIGGTVYALTTVPGSRYAFAGTSTSSSQILVLDLGAFARGVNPVLKNYNAHATVKGLFYDWRTDRLYAVTTSGLLVFAPG